VNFVNNQVDAADRHHPTSARDGCRTLTACSRPASMGAVSSKGAAEYMAMLIDDKAIMTDRGSQIRLCLDRRTRSSARTFVLAASMMAAG